MDGALFARWIEQELAARGISKGEFYEAVGISATAMYGWRKGSEPKRESVDAIEKYLGAKFETVEKSDIDDETLAVLEWIREDYGHRALFEAARHLSTAESLDAAAYIVRLKAGET